MERSTLVPGECSLCAAMVAHATFDPTAQLHCGAPRATPPTHARDEVRPRATLLHGPAADVEHGDERERRDDADVVRERTVRGRLRVGPHGGGGGDARGAAAAAAPTRGRLWARGLAGARTCGGRRGGRGAVRARTEAPPVRLLSWGSARGRGPRGAQRDRRRGRARRRVRDGGRGADAGDSEGA